MMNKLRQWMYGRYGNDELSLFMWIVSLVLLVASSIVTALAKTEVLGYVALGLRGLGLVLLILMLLRMFSRNISRRQAENYKFLNFGRKFKKLFRRRPDAKTHRYFKCPGCGQTVRVPRNKGKISITCPRCATKFIKKT